MITRPVDLRLAVPASCLWLAEGSTIWASGLGWEPGPLRLMVAGFVGVVAVAGALACWRIRGVRGFGVTMAVAGVCLIVGMGIAVLRIVPLSAEPVAQMVENGAVATVTGRLVEPMSVQARQGAAWNSDEGSGGVQQQWTARIAADEVREGNQSWRVAVPIVAMGTVDDSLRIRDMVPGSQLLIKGTFTRADDRPGFAAKVRVRGPPMVVRDAPEWQQIAHEIRAGLREAANPLASDPRGLLPGLVVGDESNLDPDLRDSMRAAGLSHLTAVSGANLAIVSGSVLFLARGLRASKQAAAGLAGAAMLTYVVVVGPQPSVLRATAMGLVALMALATSRERSGLAALAVSVAVLLVVDPWLAVSLGFALSVAATGALVVFAQFGAAGGRSGAGLLPILWRAAVVVVGGSCAAAAATTPLIAAMGNGIPLASVVANSMVALAVPLATVLGFIAAVMAPGSAAVGGFFAELAGYPTGFISAVARWAIELPMATIGWPGGLVGFLLSAGLIAVALAAWLGRHRILDQTWRSPRGRPLMALSGLLLAAGIIWGRDLDGWPPPNWVMVMCDVGQGDAIALNAGDGAVMLVDVGPDPKPVDRCLDDLGIVDLEVVVLTHFHVDHVGGLSGALKGRAVRRVIGSPLRSPTEQADQVDRALAERDLAIEPAQVGEAGTVGDLTYRLLWPSEVVGGSESPPNNASVAALVTVSGVNILLTGDIEPNAQEALMRTVSLPRIDVVKVPHHGSRNQAPALVGWSGPAQIAAVSVGRGNRYGHPSPGTIAGWQAVGARVLRTDTDGDIAIVRGDGGASVAIRGSNDR